MGAGIDVSGRSGGSSDQLVAADFHIDFTNIPDGALPSDPVSGYYIKATGPGTAVVDGGYMVNSVDEAASYAMVSTRRKLTKMKCFFEFFAGPGDDSEDATIALVAMQRSQATAGASLAHPIITQTGWAIQKFVGGTPTPIIDGDFAVPLELDTEYEMTVEMDLDSGILTLTDPYGGVHQSDDDDLHEFWGRHYFFEIAENVDSPKGKIRECQFWEDVSEPIMAPRRADWWLPTNASDGTVAVAENIENGRFHAFSDLAVLTSGVMYEVGGMVLPGGVPINRLEISSGLTPANAPLNQWMALMDRKGMVIAVSDDKENEAWGASTIKTFNFNMVELDGPTPVMVGLMVRATTPPTLIGNSLGTNVSWQVLDYLAGSAAATGLTTPIPVDATRRPIAVPSAGVAYVAAY